MATTTERGYGYAHVMERRRLAGIVAAGGATCVRCGHPIVDGKIRLRLKSGGFRLVSNWVADHDRDRTGYLGPAHFRCNARAGGRASGKRRAALRPRGVFGPLSS